MTTSDTAGGGGDDATRARSAPAHPVPPAASATESAEWLRVTLSSIGDGVITTDAHGRVTFLNPVAQALTGWTPAQAIGVPLERVFRIVNEDTRHEVENPALRALKEGVIVGLANHTLLIDQGGAERPIDDSAAPIRGADGAIVGAVLVFRDISERRRQELLLQDSADYAFNILGTLRHAFLVLDKSLRVVSANRSFYDRFRVAPEQTDGRFIYELGNGEWDIPRLRELLEEVLPRNHSFDDFEVEHDFPRGLGRKTMLLNARRIVRQGNQSELILLAIEDITERKRVEQALRESEVRYRRLFQTAKDGILILDAHTGKITDANDFMGELTGRPPAELLGKELHEIGMFNDVEENKEAFRELQRTGYLRHDHLPVRNQRGQRVEVEFIANVYQEDHTLVAQCNVRDIAERSRLEKQVVKQSEALAAQSRGKDEFLAMLSHELRNPLAPIRSAVHLLRLHERAAGNPIQQQAREIIERQVANLTKMVSDLLEVSRVVSGRIRLDLQPADLNQIVEHAVQTTAPLLEQRKHTLSVELGAAPLWAKVDPTRLEEVLVNLLTNAAKYTPDGGRIHVSCGPHPAGEPTHAVVRVRDNGVGIDADLLPRIFDLFTQADRSLARSAGGLGIGLSLAHRLVAMHTRTIAAHSDGPGKGSEFTVSLPLIVAPSPAAPGAEAPADLAPPSDGTGDGQVRVLLVDDNVDLVTMLSGALRLKGYRVQSAYTGPDGLKKAQQWRPDIVLLDIGLPGLDGYEVARRLRSDPAPGGATDGNTGGIRTQGGARMRLIALTGYGQDADIALAREAGFDGHMVKPCDFDELERLMTAPAPKI